MQVLSLLFSLVIACSAFAAQVFETSDLADVHAKAVEIAPQYGGSQNVLVVFDLDNTLLKQSQSLGSDQWFRWQEDAVLNNKEIPSKVAKDFSELLDVQGVLFYLSPMESTQSDAPAILSQLKAKGFAVIALTSRGMEFRDATMKHMRNGFEFSSFGYSGKSSHAFLPYNNQDLSSIGLPADLDPQIIKSLKLDKPARPVNFTDGVFFSGGQHKGAMMLAILHLLSLKPKAVIFVDDQTKHVDRMGQALALKPIDLYGFRYSRIDREVQDFELPDSPEKSRSVFDWENLRNTVKSIFGQKALPAEPQAAGVQ
ncbi:MAG: DUF2608 domain-containing protein [Bdellovibrionaceae bacterium]|nr:DUF2608 domain-containing protein [Bdellovibrionales bacterium]MCB9085729.1 DUF2608 domain-containing protein [Pseudobdellovibrionaceae bacterium]